MNITLLASDIASRVPDMAKDSPINNAAMIEGLIRDCFFSLIHDRPAKRSSSIDWSSVDWNKPNRQIASELGVTYSYVASRRHFANGPHISKLSSVPWDTVDWSQTNGQIAAQLGTTATSVRIWRMKLGQKNHDFRLKIPHLDLSKINWELSTDVMISRQLHVSRERVRQIRQEQHLPECRFKHLPCDAAAFCVWVETNREQLKDLDPDTIISRSNSSLSRTTLKKLLKYLGFKVEKNSSWEKWPWDKMNWDLPNQLLQMIYRTPHNSAASCRCRGARPKARWSIAGFRTKWISDPEFYKALSNEILKAHTLGFDPDGKSIYAYLEKKADGFGLTISSPSASSDTPATSAPIPPATIPSTSDTASDRTPPATT